MFGERVWLSRMIVVVEWARARSYLLGQAAKSVISPDNVHVAHMLEQREGLGVGDF